MTKKTASVLMMVSLICSVFVSGIVFAAPSEVTSESWALWSTQNQAWYVVDNGAVKGYLDPDSPRGYTSLGGNDLSSNAKALVAEIDGKGDSASGDSFFGTKGRVNRILFE